MKRTFLTLLVALICLGAFSGCCNSEIIVDGQITDADNGNPVDSVRVTLYLNDKGDIASQAEEFTDSTGQFTMWESGYCEKTQFFITATKQGYITYTGTIEIGGGGAVDIELVPD